jgi:hypothetical protein
MTSIPATLPADELDDLELPPGFITDPPPPEPPRVPIPVAPRHLLAVRQHDGQPITRLSKSSFETFADCPEAWRRRYVLGERYPTQPRMVLGNIVDGARTWLALQRIAGEQPEQGDLRRHYLHHAIPAALEREKHGIAWCHGELLEDLRVLGWRAILAFRRDLDPLLGRALAAQRKLEFKLTPDATWVVQGFIDLELLSREAIAVSPENGQPITYAGTGEPVAIAVNGTYVQSIEAKKPRGRDYLKAHGLEYMLVEQIIEEIADYKVVAKAPSQADADADMQATTYLAGRVIEGRPATRFRWLALCKPTKTLGFRARTLATYRTQRQRHGVLARYANVARSINAQWREHGPLEAWSYTDPRGSWRCRESMCHFWGTCAGGAGF